MKYIDLHQDLKLSLEKPELLDTEHLRNPQTNFQKLEQNGVGVVLCTGFPMPDDGDFFKKRNFDDLFEDIDWYQAHTEAHENWILVRSAGDIDTCINGEKNGLLFHLEGINMFDGDTEDWDRLDQLHQRGLRSFALTWSRTNALSGGNDDPKIGITALGHELIEWALERNIILDLAHISRAGFHDFAERYSLPLLVSHGAADALCPNDRNYTDDQLRAIGESGGCLGVFFSRRFLCGEGSCALADAVRHLEHVKNVAGSDAVALGSDFGGVVSGTLSGLSSLDDLEALVTALKQAGWSDDECQKFAAKNAARVLKAHLSA